MLDSSPESSSTRRTRKSTSPRNHNERIISETGMIGSLLHLTRNRAEIYSDEFSLRSTLGQTLKYTTRMMGYDPDSGIRGLIGIVEEALRAQEEGHPFRTITSSYFLVATDLIYAYWDQLSPESRALYENNEMLLAYQRRQL